MKKSFQKIFEGYQRFRKKYATGDNSLMEQLADRGQTPEVMVIACSDSRVDPALILQSKPGDLFTVRNVANIVPPYENDTGHHGVSAALEFGICYLHVKHLIVLGHSQCGGINALLNHESLGQNDFISNWVALLKPATKKNSDPDHFAPQALLQSYQNCLTFPWIKSRLDAGALKIHLWYFDIKDGAISSYSFAEQQFLSLESLALDNDDSTSEANKYA